jgi:hypothetical protein
MKNKRKKGNMEKRRRQKTAKPTNKQRNFPQ